MCSSSTPPVWYVSNRERSTSAGPGEPELLGTMVVAPCVARRCAWPRCHNQTRADPFYVMTRSCDRGQERSEKVSTRRLISNGPVTHTNWASQLSHMRQLHDKYLFTVQPCDKRDEEMLLHGRCIAVLRERFSKNTTWKTKTGLAGAVRHWKADMHDLQAAGSPRID